MTSVVVKLHIKLIQIIMGTSRGNGIETEDRARENCGLPEEEVDLDMHKNVGTNIPQRFGTSHNINFHMIPFLSFDVNF